LAEIIPIDSASFALDPAEKRETVALNCLKAEDDKSLIQLDAPVSY
jgi:hypothetical protein